MRHMNIFGVIRQKRALVDFSLPVTSDSRLYDGGIRGLLVSCGCNDGQWTGLDGNGKSRRLLSQLTLQRHRVRRRVRALKEPGTCN